MNKTLSVKLPLAMMAWTHYLSIGARVRTCDLYFKWVFVKDC